MHFSHFGYTEIGWKYLFYLLELPDEKQKQEFAEEIKTMKEKHKKHAPVRNHCLIRHNISVLTVSQIPIHFYNFFRHFFIQTEPYLSELSVINK